jgi:hypothetical protein
MRDNARIVNIGWGNRLRAGLPACADYAATKAGPAGYTKGARPAIWGGAASPSETSPAAWSGPRAARQEHQCSCPSAT